jgi:hypothetical protein
MKKSLLAILLFGAVAAQAQTLGPPLTVLPLQPTPFPFSFCGQYPNHPACQPRKEEMITRCIDGFLYKKETDQNGRVKWVQLFYANGEPRTCKVCMLPEGCAKKD